LVVVGGAASERSLKRDASCRRAGEGARVDIEAVAVRGRPMGITT